MSKNQKVKNGKSEEALEQLLDGAEDIRVIHSKDESKLLNNSEEQTIKLFKEKATLKHCVLLFVAEEMEKVRKHIRMLKNARKLYEEINRDVAKAKTEKDVIEILGEGSELVQWWKENNPNEAQAASERDIQINGSDNKK